jgi:hypothetical protein
MKKNLLILGLLLSIVVIGYLTYRFISGIRYGEENWKFRKASKTVEESMEREVFVKRLNYKFDFVVDTPHNFEAFIEKAFTYGRNGIDETVLIKGSNYPFRLSFRSRPSNDVQINIIKSDLQKFDSANASWGFMNSPELPDTISLFYIKHGKQLGLIRVW